MAFPDEAAMEATPATLREGAKTPDDQAREALEIVSALKDRFKERNKLYEDIDSVIFLENAVQIPKAFQNTAIEVRSPLPSHLINSVTSALSVNAPRVLFDPVGIGEPAQENAALREEFFQASWLRQEQEANLRIFRRFMHALVSKGEAIIKTAEYKKRAWAGYNKFAKSYREEVDRDKKLDSDSRDRLYDAKTEEYKRGAPYPIRSIDVPPESFYYIKGEDGFTLAAEVKKVDYLKAFADYGVSVDARGRVVPEAMGLALPECASFFKEDQTLTMTELWKWDECIYILQGPGNLKAKGNTGFIVKKLKHRYGDKNLKTLRGPYFHCYGITTSSREVHKQGLSVLFGYLHLFPLLDSLLTIQSQAAYTFGFPAFKRVRPQGVGPIEMPFGVDALEMEMYQDEIKPGYIYPDDIAPIDQPRTGIDLDKSIALVRSLLELALPSVAQGLVQGGESGYAINQAAHLARLAWNPIIDNAEFALAQRVSFESRLIEECIKEKVYVWGESPRSKLGKSDREDDSGWQALGPDDIKGNHRYRIKLEPETPSNLTIELRTHQQMLEMQVETLDDAIRALGKNPVKVRRGWLLEELIRDPAIRDRIKKSVFNDLATIDQKKMEGIEGPGAAPGTAEPPASATPPGAPPGVPVVPGMPQDQQAPSAFGARPPGTPPGMAGGVRNSPQRHVQLPGEGGG
jgi:hypothetical protein